jgi:hypothetical protein
MNPDPLMDTSPDRSVDFSSALEELEYLLPKVVQNAVFYDDLQRISFFIAVIANKHIHG